MIKVDVDKDSLRNIIGTNIRNARVTRNLSIDETAELIGRTPGFLGLIERGRRGATAYTLYKLSQKLEIPVDHLFNEPYETGIGIAEEDPVAAKRTKLNALICDLNADELEFIISVVKNLKTFTRVANERVDMDDDEDEDDVSAERIY